MENLSKINNSPAISDRKIEKQKVQNVIENLLKFKREKLMKYQSSDTVNITKIRLSPQLIKE